MREFPEKDWKLFRQKRPGWQEAADEAITLDDLEEFSDDAKEAVRIFLK